MAAREKTGHIRQRIIEATDDLLYHKGFNLMSFSDIADASHVPRGNLYYYFRTKDEVLAAVIEHRLQRMRQMLDEWERTIPDPVERLKRYARIPVIELDNMLRYGCPMGSLNSELGKSQRELRAVTRRQFDLFRDWLAAQFRQLTPDIDADGHAMHLLVWTQGIASLSQAYDDAALVTREIGKIDAWLEQLPEARV